MAKMLSKHCNYPFK